ncbi:hypothetical protein ACWLZS_004616 [Vibrio parahaemolyticus]|uniref:hypothetical protein n=1 Tax=Vibrio TaxID=662 RepID=UPI00206CEAF8|nr:MULTISPECIES: hypothetical protein [Vibrio]ELB2751593.1 hypothetical protein [Vibrio alginolyticus]MDW1592488.1 hypothetical protein [Vibrio sp. Vb2944]MDW1609994.1 hypothetical protein [Vibrio sp. Vb2908]MDW1725895.1 hypothetical protein [Vibrio sp. Vb2909]MDW1917181.1 hypothetical protein [Vibrio sp. Vb0349]
MKFQRDKVSTKTFFKLLSHIYKAVSFKVLGQIEKLEWQQILIADCLRIIGINNLAYWLATRVQATTVNEKHKFWSLHASGVALHYAGNLAEAKRAFISSQAYSCDLTLSFSLQHLGKLNVEAGNYDEALRQLNGALLIRKELKQEHLVKSTERAIQGLRELRT